MPVPVIAAGIGVAGSILGNKLHDDATAGNQEKAVAAQEKAAAIARERTQGASTSFLDFISGNQPAAPQSQDYQSFLQSMRGLASGNSPYLPQDFTNANAFASAISAPQRQALTNTFDQQRQMANQQAARLGRNINDPILNAKLAQEQTRQLSQLSANQAAAAAQEAQRLSQQRLAQSADLANRALQNKMTYLNLGLSDLPTQTQVGMNLSNIYANAPIPANPFAVGLTGAASGLAVGNAINKYNQIDSNFMQPPQTFTGGTNYSGSVPSNPFGNINFENYYYGGQR